MAMRASAIGTRRTGKDWIFGGRVMAEGVSPTTREWAGTPILLNNGGDIDLYYTCVTQVRPSPRSGGQVVTSDNGVELRGFTQVKALFEADGTYYQTEAQNSTWNFRDPSPFIDPVDGKLYMVFEGNVAGERGTHDVGPDELGLVPPGHGGRGWRALSGRLHRPARSPRTLPVTNGKSCRRWSLPWG